MSKVTAVLNAVKARVPVVKEKATVVRQKADPRWALALAVASAIIAYRKARSGE